MNINTYFFSAMIVGFTVILTLRFAQLEAIKSNLTCERFGLTVKTSSYDVKSQVIRIECEVK